MNKIKNVHTFSNEREKNPSKSNDQSEINNSSKNYRKTCIFVSRANGAHFSFELNYSD